MESSKIASANARQPRVFTPIADAPFVRPDNNGDVILDIQVMPNAVKTQVDGLYAGDGPVALKLRLKAPPVDGKANEALIKWLAAQLCIPRNAMQLVRGQTSRRKQIFLSAQTAANADWHKLIAPLQRDQAARKPPI